MAFQDNSGDIILDVVLTDEEYADVVTQYNITDKSKFPEISRFDPVAQVIGLRPNQLCKILRPSKSSITSNFYRICSQ